MHAGRVAAEGVPAAVFEAPRLSTVYETRLAVEHTPRGLRILPDRWA